MKQVFFIAALMGAMIFGTEANAQSRYNHKRVNHTQVKQHHRIKHGVRSGSLTRQETMQLRRQQMRVQNYKKMAMADGRITPAERKMIRDAQRRANYAIYAQKHDRQRRY